MPRVISFDTHKDPRGSLTVIQEKLPFQVKRIFYIYDVPEGLTRGGHGHFKTQIFLMAINGSVKLSINKVGFHQNYILNKRDEGVLLDPEDWHEMSEFSKDAVLIALASHEYDKKDYFFNRAE
jgi:dTDP-4-dehydrorhamnose 3,5-epimerase-like enzyme